MYNFYGKVSWGHVVCLLFVVWRRSVSQRVRYGRFHGVMSRDVYVCAGFHPGEGGEASPPPPPPKIWDSCIEMYIKPHPFPGASPPK